MDPIKVKTAGYGPKIGRNGRGRAYLDPNDDTKGVCLDPWQNEFMLQPDRRPEKLKSCKIDRKTVRNYSVTATIARKPP